MRKMTFEDFLQYVTTDFMVRERFDSIVHVIEKYIGRDKIQVFYPKYLFIEDKRLIFFVFQSEQVSIVNEQEDSSVSLCTLKYRNISKIELHYIDDYEPLTLKITFNTGDIIELVDTEDTNRSWSERFTNKIEEIYKLLA